MNRIAWRSSVWRYTAMYTVLVLVIISLLAGATWWQAIRALQRQQEQTIVRELAQFRELSEDISLSDFRRAVYDRMRLFRRVMIAWDSPDGMVGNLNALPQSVQPWPLASRFIIFSPSLIDHSRLREVIGSRIDTRYGPVVLAIDSSELDRVAARAKQAVALAMIGAILLTGIFGFILSRRLFRRIDSINRITQEIEDGKLSARLPVNIQGDELDYLSDRVNHMLNRIDDTMHSIRTVTDSIAHDLRTPLARLRLRLENLLTEQPEDSPLGDELEITLSELDQILATFQAILELSKLEQGTSHRHFETLSMRELWQDVIELAEPQAEEKQQTIALHHNNALQIDGDRSLLFRMCYNLLDNAIKYSPENSNIDITINHHGWSIADQGSGIPDEEKQKVFRRLYRIDSSRTLPGYGLGLSLAQAVARLHGAEIELTDNHPGLNVTITFPEQP
ncbi:HAMP domain-containing histidine kinase [Kistimonas scapharcae]|uniref:histidine kinase n=1 Tax=Kistimonas scapharcae TaxID=1036133 RepID=A0ABP8V7C1_9GAMM